MTKLVLFLNAFMSYLFLFLFIVALMLLAGFIGVKWRKSQDAKAALEAASADTAVEDESARQ